MTDKTDRRFMQDGLTVAHVQQSLLQKGLTVGHLSQALGSVPGQQQGNAPAATPSPSPGNAATPTTAKE